MNDNDFTNIEYHGAQRALKDKMNSKLWEAKKLVENAANDDFATVAEKTGEAMRLLSDVKDLYLRTLANKAKRHDGVAGTEGRGTP